VRFGERSHPECAGFSPDGRFCCSGSVDGFVEVWDYEAAALRKDLAYQESGGFMMHDTAVICLAFARDSELLATGSQDGQLKVWRVATGECARRFERAHGQGITSVCWSRDSSQLLTASFDQTARVHGLKSGKTLREFRGHSSFVNAALYTRDGARVVTGSSDGRVLVFDARTTEQLASLSPPPPPHAGSEMQFAVNAVALAPRPAGEQEDLLLVCSRMNTIHLMNLGGQVLRSFSSGKREQGDFVAMTTSPRGEWLYACAEDNRLYCFSTETGVLEQTMKVAEKEVVGLAHHPARNIVAAFSSDGTLAFLRP